MVEGCKGFGEGMRESHSSRVVFYFGMWDGFCVLSLCWTRRAALCYMLLYR